MFLSGMSRGILVIDMHIRQQLVNCLHITISVLVLQVNLGFKKITL